MLEVDLSCGNWAKTLHFGRLYGYERFGNTLRKDVVILNFCVTSIVRILAFFRIKDTDIISIFVKIYSLCDSFS